MVTDRDRFRIAQIKAAHVRRQTAAAELLEHWRQDRHQELDALPADAPIVIARAHRARLLRVLETYRRLIFGGRQRKEGTIRMPPPKKDEREVQGGNGGA